MSMYEGLLESDIIPRLVTEKRSNLCDYNGCLVQHSPIPAGTEFVKVEIKCGNHKHDHPENFHLECWKRAQEIYHLPNFRAA